MKPPSSPSVIPVSSGEALRDKAFLRESFRWTGLSRLNFVTDDFEASIGLLGELGDEYFSWYVMFGEAGEISTPRGMIEEQVTTAPSPEEKEILLETWRRDYADAILQEYSPAFRDAQVSALRERLDEGVHYIYRDDGLIVGHGCWVEDLHSVYPVRCLYWHQWVSRSLPSARRAAIHSRFFSALRSQGVPPMSGVAVVNERALRHCLRNGMKPVMISVRKLCG